MRFLRRMIMGVVPVCVPIYWLMNMTVDKGKKDA